MDQPNFKPRLLRFDDLAQAAADAYRAASKWGGAFVVAASPSEGGCFAVAAERIGLAASLAAAGYTEVGRAVSRSANELSWQWADGRQEPPPASPFDKAPQPLRGPVVSDLAPETQTLLEWTEHVLAIQRAFSRGDLHVAGRLLRQDPPPLAGDVGVRHAAYLRVAEENGRVEAETSRLKATLAFAASRFEPGTDGRESAGIVFGRIRLPSGPAEEPAAPGI